MLCLPKYPMSKDSNRFKHHISVLYNIIYIHNIIYISCMCQHSESWKQDETSRNFNPLEKRTMLIYADICWYMLIYADHVLYQPASFGSFPILNHPQCSDLDTSHTSTAVVPTSSSVDPRLWLGAKPTQSYKKNHKLPKSQRMQRCGCDFLDSAEMFWLF